MNLKEFENYLILNGSNLSGWKDKSLSKQVQIYISKTKKAEKIYLEYKELDKKLNGLHKAGYPANLEKNILSSAFENGKENIQDNFLVIFLSKSMVSILSLIIVVAIAVTMLNFNFSSYSDDEVYAYANQIMYEIQMEDEIRNIESEASKYQEMNGILSSI